jgi:hypothetical protein
MNRPVSNTLCVLYDQGGKIAHTHRVLTFLGGRIVPEQEIEGRAKECAQAPGHDTSRLNTLLIPGEGQDNLSNYRIDVSKKELVKAQIAVDAGRA